MHGGGGSEVTTLPANEAVANPSNATRFGGRPEQGNAAGPEPEPEPGGAGEEQITRVTCTFCSQQLSFPTASVHTALSDHLTKACTAVQNNPHLLVNSLQRQGHPPTLNKSAGQGKCLAAVNLEVYLRKHHLTAFRASRYKLEKKERNRDEDNHSPVERFSADPHVPLDSRDIAGLVLHVNFEDSVGLPEIKRKLEAVRKANDGIVRAAAVRTTQPQLTSNKEGVRVHIVVINLHLAMPPIPELHERPGDSLEANCQSTDEKATSAEFKLNARRVLDRLNLAQKIGAKGCSIASCKALPFRDVYVPYRVTVPLKSTEKATKIIGEVWANGCSYIIARPTTGTTARTSELLSWTTHRRPCHIPSMPWLQLYASETHQMTPRPSPLFLGNYAESIRTPVVRAWISNPNFVELAQSNEVIRMLHWVSRIVAGSTGAAEWIGQVSTPPPLATIENGIKLLVLN